MAPPLPLAGSIRLDTPDVLPEPSTFKPSSDLPPRPGMEILNVWPSFSE